MMRISDVGFVAAAALMLAACSGKSTPTPPSSDSGPPPEPCATTPATTAASAGSLDAGSTNAVAFCARDRFFALDLAAGDVVSISVSFSNASGDIDLEVIDPDGVPVAGSAGTSNAEQITNVRANLTGRYLVHLYGKDLVKIRSQFDMTLTIAHNSSCADDTLEPNDVVDAATVIADGGASFLSLTLCANNKDLFRIELSAGDSFTASLATDAGLSQSVFRIDPEAPSPVRTIATGASLSYGPAALGETVYLTISGSQGATGPYDLTVDRGASQGGRAVNLSGQFAYERQLVTADGYVNQGYKPVALVRVEAVSAATGGALAQTTTDDAGAYRFPELRTFGDAGIYVRAIAQRFDSIAKLEVRNNAVANAIVAAVSPAFDETADGGTLTVNVDIPQSSGAAGAFHVLAVAGLAAAYVQSMTGKTMPPLAFYWMAGTATGCYTCYQNSVIFIGSSPSDPDEYDDSVILHEIGHHIVASFSRDDSIGGTHDGSRTSPALAFSEGFADFFSCAARGDSVYLDYKTSDVAVRDFETISTATSYGTSNGQLAGDVSESLVTAVLWDMFDQPGDSADGLTLSYATIFEPLGTYFISSSFANRGASGRDFVDYLDGWFCRGHGYVSEMTTLLQARQFPYDFQASASCYE